MKIKDLIEKLNRCLKVDCSYYSWNLDNIHNFQVVSNGDLVNDIQVNIDELDKGTKILYYDGGY